MNILDFKNIVCNCRWDKNFWCGHFKWSGSKVSFFILKCLERQILILNYNTHSIRWCCQNTCNMYKSTRIHVLRVFFKLNIDDRIVILNIERSFCANAGSVTEAEPSNIRVCLCPLVCMLFLSCICVLCVSVTWFFFFFLCFLFVCVRLLRACTPTLICFVCVWFVRFILAVFSFFCYVCLHLPACRCLFTDACVLILMRFCPRAAFGFDFRVYPFACWLV